MSNLNEATPSKGDYVEVKEIIKGKEYSWYYVFDDTSHVLASMEKPGKSAGKFPAYHIRQLKDKPYFKDLVSWMNTGNKAIEKKSYKINESDKLIDNIREDSLTTGMLNKWSKTGTASSKVCDNCGFVLPKYKGRYPKTCPNCDRQLLNPDKMKPKVSADGFDIAPTDVAGMNERYDIKDIFELSQSKKQLKSVKTLISWVKKFDKETKDRVGIINAVEYNKNIDITFKVEGKQINIAIDDNGEISVDKTKAKNYKDFVNKCQTIHEAVDIISLGSTTAQKDSLEMLISWFKKLKINSQNGAGVTAGGRNPKAVEFNIVYDGNSTRFSVNTEGKIKLDTLVIKSLDTLKKVFKRMTESEELTEKRKKLTQGMIKNFNSKFKGKEKMYCGQCNLIIPKYKGRYPNSCPNCNGSLIRPSGTSGVDKSVASSNDGSISPVSTTGSTMVGMNEEVSYSNDFVSWFTGTDMYGLKHPEHGRTQLTTQQIKNSSGKFKSKLFNTIQKAIKDGDVPSKHLKKFNIKEAELDEMAVSNQISLKLKGIKHSGHKDAIKKLKTMDTSDEKKYNDALTKLCLKHGIRPLKEKDIMKDTDGVTAVVSEKPNKKKKTDEYEVPVPPFGSDGESDADRS